MSSINTRAVREEDEDKSKGRGLAAAAAVVGVGLAIGGALYYFFKPDEQDPHAAHSSTHRPHLNSEYNYEHRSAQDYLMAEQEQEEMNQINEMIYRERAWSPEQCSICLELMLSEQPERPSGELWMLPCGHKFHLQCVQPWTQVHNTCPNCRKPI